MTSKIASIFAAIALAGGLTTPVAAQSRGDQANARKEMQAGRSLSSSEIERRIVPRMKGSEYLGFEYDSVANVYRLKFIREGQVTWVDVDARTGQVQRISK